jgi:hypothetical protein
MPLHSPTPRKIPDTEPKIALATKIGSLQAEASTDEMGRYESSHGLITTGCRCRRNLFRGLLRSACEEDGQVAEIVELVKDPGNVSLGVQQTLDSPKP